MILVTHPRAGSEWFFDCLLDSRYVCWEIFGGLHLMNDNESPMPHLSPGAKELAIRSTPPTRSHKIMLYYMWDTIPHDHSLIAHLRGRDDVYLLRRRNVRAAIISILVGIHNGLNFHGDHRKLVQPFVATRQSVENWVYRMHHIFSDPAKALTYRETMWYEDLLEGKLPETLRLDINRSRRPIRRSASLGLLQNMEEVNRWMDELEVPGQL